MWDCMSTRNKRFTTHEETCVVMRLSARELLYATAQFRFSIRVSLSGFYNIREKRVECIWFWRVLLGDQILETHNKRINSIC